MRILNFVLLVLCLSQGAFADTRLQQKLRAFHAAPAAFLNTLPSKYSDPELTQVAPRTRHFTDQEVADNSYVSAKSLEWDACHRQEHASAAFAIANDPLRQFFSDDDYMVIESLQEMDARHWLTADTQVHPWSGDYWPIANGVLAARYFANSFTVLSDWLSRYKYIQANPAAKLIAAGNMDSLSAAEKYDLIVGDNGGSFTASQWQQGQAIYNRAGKVEQWMGICHGWSPASIMEDRPQNKFTVPTRDGRQVPIYPSEVKGYLSYSWANNEYDNKQIGERCDEKNPKTDANGRILNPACFDLDPGVWHKLVVNHLSGLNRAFIIDATYDYEVWNQPVFGYSYTYFNPETKQPANSLHAATIRMEEFKNDIFSKYRSRQAKTVVGISMKIGYTVETRADNETTNSPSEDVVRWVEYLYDLELDGAGKIIGGEWYQNAHPDFAWAPVKGARPQAYSDGALARTPWTNGPLPANWAAAAQQNSGSGVLLNSIAEALLQRARE